MLLILQGGEGFREVWELVPVRKRSCWTQGVCLSDSSLTCPTTTCIVLLFITLVTVFLCFILRVSQQDTLEHTMLGHT